MINKQRRIAEYLLQIKAIKLEPASPFTWASGWKSPIYCDNRKTLSYPEIRDFIRDCFVETIQEKYPDTQLIAGVATGGIAQGALVADRLNLPFAYVRSSPKGHGLENLVEGVVSPEQHVVVIEDLVSTGGSSLKAIQALQQKGCNVLGMIAIFTYGFNISEERFSAAGIPMSALSNYDHLLDQALDSGEIRQEQLSVLRQWKSNPADWEVS